MRSLLLVTAAAFTAMLIVSALLAHATAPGQNGRIVFRRFLDSGKTRAALFTVNPDGTKVRQVTHPGPAVGRRCGETRAVRAGW